MTPRFARRDDDTTIPLHVIDAADAAGWLEAQDPATRAWAGANGFDGGLGQALTIPGPDGRPHRAVAGLGSDADRARRRFRLAEAAAKLPKATYDILSGPEGAALETECFGWLMAGHRFDRYTSRPGLRARLVAPEAVDAARIEAWAAGEALTRDLIDTPASDMGPDELEAAARTLAEAFGGRIDTVAGDDLLAQNFPMIHAVGRASPRAPRLIDLRWGDSGPRVTLVGKGVCFDTGGLDLKPAAGMALMKKDMGGAATVLGLARMIMALDIPLRLRVLIPAVENAVAGNAMRPGDILVARNGLSVEVNNTDAEGRLVLADALALAVEEDCDLLVSMATLTGAARVAVGPDLAPFYCDDDAAAETLAQAARAVADPVWRLPFHAPYETMIEPDLADLDNAPSGGFAGSITAALFLRRFAGAARYMHFDIYGWNPTATAARPKGGTGQGARALLRALPGLVGV